VKDKVAVIHTFLYSVEDLKKQFAQKVPEVEMVNIVDDSLLTEALENKGITANIIRKICAYAVEAEQMGCKCILNQCSSVGEASEAAQKLIKIPYLKIDQPMAREAVRLGKNIAVIATAISTVGPSTRLVESEGKKAGKEVHVSGCFAEGAYDVLLKENNREKHNQIVVATIEKAAQTHDVIVLAQGSMYHLMPLLGHIKVPVLTSLESGVEQIRGAIGL
jgi:Asp/Glu/hydantoin racemase